MVNLYAFYILENALRISVLEILGIEVSDDIKKYIMDDHLDWIKLKKHLEEDCVLPMNVFRQMIERLQNLSSLALGSPRALQLQTLGPTSTYQ